MTLREVSFDRDQIELDAWHQLVNRFSQGEPFVIPAGWPQEVAYIAETILGFSKGMMELDDLRPTCPTCNGDTDFDCPENDYDCDGKMSFERMAAWCLYVINLPPGPLTRDELWDVR